MADQVFMNIDAVEQIEKGFGTMGDTLQTVSKGLEIAANILKATAFFGMVGNLIWAHYAERIKAVVDKLRALCEEFRHGVHGAIISYRDGDNTGSQLFT